MTNGENCFFNLDTEGIKEKRARFASPFILSGWLIPHANHQLRAIEIHVNGELRALATCNLKRQDVANAFPQNEGALWSGFEAEIYADDLPGKNINVVLRASFDDADEQICQFKAEVKEPVSQTKPRAKSWSLMDLIVCPVCGANLIDESQALKCSLCKRAFEKRRNIPLFIPPNEVVHSRLLQTHPTNPLSEEQKAFIENLSDGVILNFGAGNPRESEHYPNVLFHEMVHYPHTDIVSTYDKLPYQDESFDAVISLAVFEHLPRPWEMANELHRVLKPGGIVWVDTAFMQPLHADPYHWFNMTLEGVKEIFKQFRIIEAGIKNYQNPSYGLRMQIEIILDHLHSDKWHKTFEELRDSLTEDFDNSLDERGRECLAAGVFYKGSK